MIGGSLTSWGVGILHIISELDNSVKINQTYSKTEHNVRIRMNEMHCGPANRLPGLFLENW